MAFDITLSVGEMSFSILVVDDGAELLASYQRLLDRLGHRVTPAMTRRTALELLDSEQFDLVIVEPRLFDGDGFDVVRAARRRRKPVPVIIITGFPSGPGHLQAQEAGVAAYLPKPFSVAMLTRLIEEILSSRPKPVHHDPSTRESDLPPAG